MPRCIILYHYYYPDNVVSARHFTDFAESLSSKGWDVQVFTSSYYCRKAGTIFPHNEVHHEVHIRRFSHPVLPQSKNIGRLLNSFFLSVKWFFALLLMRTDVVIFGTDPQFSFYMIPLLIFFRPQLPIVIWGFDLYPEAIFADGIRVSKIVKKMLQWWAGISYRCCGLLVDIGSCMRSRFSAYHPHAKYETIVPWALKESIRVELPPDSTIRHELFGNAELGLLYSGTIGKAHQFKEFVLLARELRRRNTSIAFCFAGQGNSYHELQKMITSEDYNIRFAGFIDEVLLPLRLAAADMHLISLRYGWEGIVVPSKFFGSLAAGRPLLYCGTPDSCIAKWIKEEHIGFIIDMDTIELTADRLETLSHNRSQIIQMQEHALLFYNQHFSKEMQWVKWDKILRDYIKRSS
ncbi:MAG: glycosyltransferase family 4 protein [Treponema sp.]|jgi:glycosyltransferase involved in cell wall biosynthesis|nr:glycosyltransferase family 4 protein [Treponema sp.]